LKKAMLITIIIAILSAGSVFWVFQRNLPQLDTVAVNNAVMMMVQEESAVVSVDVLVEELTQVFDEMDLARRERDGLLQIFLYVMIAILALSGILLYVYYEWAILAPFRKLQGIAKHIAAGNFDTPLEMDRNNLFGAFTESFELMREELYKARENENKANQSKKELVASFSHDIKTPVASKKAVTELMLVKATDEKEQERLTTINAKAEQINTLITDMFHATLEELQALLVSAEEVLSTEIPSLIQQADYDNRITSFSIPNCLVLTDLLRLQQVFDNIISNSYKYAGTKMDIRAFFEPQYLVIEVKDFGHGVPEEELPLLCNKFYRGKQVQKESGYGLGLFISQYFIEQMSGKLECENQADGFVVKIWLQLA